MVREERLVNPPVAPLETAAGRRAPQSSDLAERLFVFGVWAGLTLSVVVLIVRFGSSIPLMDDWHFISSDVVKLGAPQARDRGPGGTPLLDQGVPPLGWLWEQVADHRFPIAKLTMWALWQAFPGDLRPAMLCGFLCLALGTVGLIHMTRRMRGRSEYQDAFFPALLLSFGHAGVFLWWTTMQVPWYTAIASLLLAMLVASDPTSRWSRLLLFGLGVLVLPLMGSLGVATSLPLLGALCIAIPSCLRRSRARGAAAALCVAVAGAIIAAYFWNFRREGVQSPFVSVGAWAAASLQYLTTGFGPGMKRFWPVSGLAVVLLGTLAAGVLAHRIFRPAGSEASRMVPLLALLAFASPVVGAVAVGLGRQLQGGLVGRYGLYAAPFACVVYAVFAKYGPRRLAQLVQNGLCFFACAGLFFGFSNGLALAKQRKEREKELRENIRSGLPMTAIVAQHAAAWGLNEDSFRVGLEVLKKHRVGMFADIADDPEIAEKPFPASEPTPIRMERRDTAWSVSGRESMLIFKLPEPRRVYGIRFTYVLRGKRGSTTFRVLWSRPGDKTPFQAIASTDVSVNFNSAKPRRLEVQTVWINQTVDGFAISPSADACEFELGEVRLLVPP